MIDDEADRDAPDLTHEVRELRQQVERLNNQTFFRRHGSLWRYGLAQVFSGLTFGLGSVLGATLLVSTLVYMLSSIDFIPVLGDWATQIIDHIKQPE